jgi:cystathionine gamma-lyase/homocysteine desulfhydrase
MEESRMRKKTKLIHGGISTDKETGAVSIPIYHSSTYKQEEPGEPKEYEYARTGNPTRFAVEELIKDLEEGERGFAFSSGMAAITSVVLLFQKGDHFLLSDDVYGGSFRVITKVLSRFGIEATFVDTSKVENIEPAIKKNTKAIFIETPTNPLLKITNIKEAAAIAKRYNLLTIVDNTFSTPYWQNPLTLGSDIVLHSATKYLGGHSDVVAGLAVVNNKKLGDDLHFVQNSTGAILSPHDSWLLMRGIKTLGIRMEEHEQNAREIVDFLVQHKEVKNVYYPGLSSHPNHSIAVTQARGFGGMISFEVETEEKARELVKKTKYFTLAESLGAVESLISIPALMTHASIPKERREQLGITDGLIRISVGLEDKDDLIEDLKEALSFQ